MQIVDRRLNPKSKSLGNRQRFLRRARGEIKDAVKDALKKRKVSEAEGGERVTIHSKSLREPHSPLATQGRSTTVPGTRRPLAEPKRWAHQWEIRYTPACSPRLTSIIRAGDVWGGRVSAGKPF